MKKKPKKPSFKYLSTKAWALMSKVRRLESRHRNSDYVTCVSCGNQHLWNEVHAGHFVHGGKGGHGNAVSYDKRNINPQCVSCNYYGSRDAQLKYAQFMFEKYGPEILDELRAIKGQSRLGINDLEEIVFRLQCELNELE